MSSTFFTKRARAADDSERTTTKKAKTDGCTSKLSPNPKRLICWNCNGLSVRLRSDSDTQALKAFVKEHVPDVLFLSEVRLPAAHNAGTRKPGPSTTFTRSRVRDTDPSFPAVSTLLRAQELVHYKTYFSLADTKYAGTAMLVNTRTTQLPTSVRFNVATLDVKRSVHDSDGRVIFAKFPAFSLLHTYVPNNGWASDHFKRRRAWDESIKAFMKRKKDAGVKVMWLGDLNIAPTDEDLTHAAYFRRQVSKPGGMKRGGGTPDAVVAPEDVGQPGCTDRERTSFNDILSTGDMSDAFRHMHPDAETFTWRGLTGGTMGGRGMRIDHCIASRSLLPCITAVDALSGDPPYFKGFMGSDHCPVMVDVCETNRTEESDKQTQETELKQKKDVEQLKGEDKKQEEAVDKDAERSS